MKKLTIMLLIIALISMLSIFMIPTSGMIAEAVCISSWGDIIDDDPIDTDTEEASTPSEVSDYRLKNR